MKKIFAILLGICLTSTMLAQTAASLRLIRVAVVDFDKVLQAFPGYANIREEIAAKRAEYDGRIREQRKAIALLEEDYTKSFSSLSPEERTRREIEIDRRKQTLAEFIIDANRSLDTLRNDMTRNIYNRIMVVVQRIGNEKRYTLILTRETAGLLFYDNNVDITSDVIARLRAEHSLHERN